MKKVLLFPIKAIWYFIAWPAIIGWKMFKFFVCNKMFSTTVGGKETGGGGIIQLGLGLVMLVGIPLAVWVGAPLVIRDGVQHFRGSHNPRGNLVCSWLGEKADEEVQSEKNTMPSKYTSTPNADTNSVVGSERPVTK